MTKLEARRCFNQNDGLPTFSFTNDSDSSPSPGISLPTYAYFSAKIDFPSSFLNFSSLFIHIFCVCVGVVRFSSNGIGNDAVPSFSGIADFSPDSATYSPSGIPLPM